MATETKKHHITQRTSFTAYLDNDAAYDIDINRYGTFEFFEWKDNKIVRTREMSLVELCEVVFGAK